MFMITVCKVLAVRTRLLTLEWSTLACKKLILVKSSLHKAFFCQLEISYSCVKVQLDSTIFKCHLSMLYLLVVYVGN